MARDGTADYHRLTAQMTMQRIRLSALYNLDNFLYLNGEDLFTGLAYNVDENGQITELHEIDEGRIKGSSADLIELPEKTRRVAEEFLTMDQDYGPLLYQGQPFTGIGYSFEKNGVCVAERLYTEGYEFGTAERTWYINGNPRSIVIDGESRVWLPDGRLQTLETEEDTILNLILTDAGLLSGIVLKRTDLFEMIEYADLGLFPNFLLIGPEITPQLLYDLRQHQDFLKIIELTFVETSIDPDALEQLTRLPNLTTIVLKDNPALTRDNAIALKRRLPECAILHNDEFITYDIE